MLSLFKRFLWWVVWGISILLLAVLVILSFFTISTYVRESKNRFETAPASGRYVNGGDVKLFIQEEGNPNDPAVIFIHGTGAWSETWRESMKAVAAEGFWVIAPDIPPFGFSELPEDSSYVNDDQVRRIIALLDDLEIKRVALVGHSYGAGIAAKTALEVPERVRGVVIVDAVLGIKTYSQITAPSLPIRLLLSVRPLRTMVMASTVMNPLFTRTLLELSVEDPNTISDSLVKVHQKQLYLEGSTRALGDWMTVLMEKEIKASRSAFADYESLTVPVALIWGEKDRIAPSSQGERLADILEGEVFTVIPGVGHYPQVENKKVFHVALIDFLNAHRR